MKKNISPVKARRSINFNRLAFLIGFNSLFGDLVFAVLIVLSILSE